MNPKVRNKSVYSSIMEDFREIFEGVSKNYRQKLIYNLLNAVKCNNQKEFFWTVFRVLNANSDNPKVAEVSEKIGKMYPLSSSEFERVAYSIILGIMSAGGGESG